MIFSIIFFLISLIFVNASLFLLIWFFLFFFFREQILYFFNLLKIISSNKPILKLIYDLNHFLYDSILWFLIIYNIHKAFL